MEIYRDRLPEQEDKRFVRILEKGTKRIEVYSDGACNNTTDKLMGIGVVCYIDKKCVHRIAEAKGVGTSNEAEWEALLAGMRWVRSMYDVLGRGMEVAFYMDSRLVIDQYSGMIGANNPRMIPYVREARKMGAELEALLQLQKHEKLWMSWIPREWNGYADELSKEGRQKNYKKRIGKMSNHLKNFDI